MSLLLLLLLLLLLSLSTLPLLLLMSVSLLLLSLSALPLLSLMLFWIVFIIVIADSVLANVCDCQSTTTWARVCNHNHGRGGDRNSAYELAVETKRVVVVIAVVAVVVDPSSDRGEQSCFTGHAIVFIVGVFQCT